MTLHWCITRSDVLTATWWSIKVVLVGNILEDILTKWRRARRKVDVKRVLYQQTVTTVFHLRWHIYVVNAWLWFVCLQAAAECTCRNRTRSSESLRRDALRVCVYAWLCAAGVEQWPLLVGWGASQTESQRFRRADVPHSSNSCCRGHRRDSHTVDEGWQSRGCNPTLRCAPRPTTRAPFSVSVCL